MPGEVRALSLFTLGEGAAEELWQAALAKVLENVTDLNTDWRARREIGLRFIFTADEERRVGDVLVSCSAKLASLKGIKIGVYIGKRQGVLTAVEAAKQEEMFPDPTPRPIAVVESA